MNTETPQLAISKIFDTRERWSSGLHRPRAPRDMVGSERQLAAT
jgi:hypothetical protein